MTPRARQNGLTSEKMDDDLVVYDMEKACAHRLNRTAALVWLNANGERTVDELVLLMQEELEPAADENLVMYALDRLAAANLLEEPKPRSADAMRTSRRQFVRKVGLVGTLSLLLPGVMTIVAPTPAQAQSAGGCLSNSQSACDSASSCDTGSAGWRASSLHWPAARPRRFPRR